MTVRLRGITWNHSRGYVSVVAAAQRLLELDSNIEVQWEKRSLQQFADYPIQKLVDEYDLLIIDHPWAGFAYESGVLVPLDQYIKPDFLENLQINSVGKSYESYQFNAQQFALPIDAATPVASYRSDLLQSNGIDVPETWEDVLELAKSGRVVIPGIPIDTLMNFYMFCVTLGAQMFKTDDEAVVVETEIGLRALEYLRELTSQCPRQVFEWNPIRVYEAMTSTNDYFYCPFAYGYSNYSRRGYSLYSLTFTDLVDLGNCGPLVSTLGGTGIAVSSRAAHIREAVKFAEFVSSPVCQKTIFFDSGGQPAHKLAWLDDEVNQQSREFFRNTLSTLERAYLRPRYSGYLDFQDHAGEVIQTYLSSGGNPKVVMQNLNEMFRKTIKGAMV